MPTAPRNQEPSPTPGGTPQGDQTPVMVEQGATEALREAAPEPVKGDGGKLVKVLWPSNEFIVEGLPVVTSDGVRVKASDVKTLEESAKACGIELEVGD